MSKEETRHVDKGNGYFPVFVRMLGAKALVVGGGCVALRKCRDLLAAGACVRVVAPDVCAALTRLTNVDIRERRFRVTDARGTALVIAATDSREVNGRVADAARRAGALVNVVDDPELSTFIVPAVLREGPVMVAVSTGGAAPALARVLRDRIAKTVTPAVGRHAAFLASARERIKKAVDDPVRRRDIFERLFCDDVRAMIETGGTRRAKALMEELLSDENAPARGARRQSCRTQGGKS